MTGKHVEKTETGTCPSCGGTLYPGTTIMTFDDELDRIIVVKGIPVDVCSQCEEAYSTSKVLDQVQEIVRKVRNTQTDVSLLSYKAANQRHFFTHSPISSVPAHATSNSN